MMLRWLVATVHLLVLPLGLGAIWARARALARVTGSKELARVFMADNLWGIAAVLWIATGLWRAFVGLEKGTAYYLHDHAFYAKMGLLIVILLLEVWPMTTLIRWRIQARRSPTVDIRVASPRARELCPGRARDSHGVRGNGGCAGVLLLAEAEADVPDRTDQRRFLRNLRRAPAIQRAQLASPLPALDGHDSLRCEQTLSLAASGMMLIPPLG